MSATTTGGAADAVPVFAPAPGAASLPRMVLAQARFELGLILRNGEQFLLTIVIPLVLLIGLSTVGIVSLGPGRPVDVATPGVLSLAVLSTAFAAQAISTGFDRRSAAIKLLGATPLPRWGLVAAKTLAVLVIEVVQVTLIVVVAFALGWQPAPGSALPAIVLLLLGTACFSALGLALAGILRAEATLAVANGVFLLLLLGGGTVIPLTQLPGPLAALAGMLPSAALGGGLRDVLLGTGLPWASVASLVVWGALGTVVAATTFRWD